MPFPHLTVRRWLLSAWLSVAWTVASCGDDGAGDDVDAATTDVLVDPNAHHDPDLQPEDTREDTAAEVEDDIVRDSSTDPSPDDPDATADVPTEDLADEEPAADVVSEDVPADLLDDAGDASDDAEMADLVEEEPVEDTADVVEDSADEEAEPPLLPDLIVFVLDGQVYQDQVSFDEDSCPVVEGCILDVGPGETTTRRLLRFSIATANVGEADLVLGPPEGNPLFEFSPCHSHYHFETFASYELRNSDGEVVAVGHKQAFCLFDNGIHLTGDDTVADTPRFSCSNQGLQRGWFDRYGAELDCQWIDITELPPGEYVIHATINGEEILEESDYSNNSTSFPLEIAQPRLDDMCPFGTADGPNRQCDWDNGGTQTCTPGATVRLGCNAEPGCDLGSSAGDPMLRVCAGDDVSCLGGIALASSNDTCGGQGPYASFICPDEGEFTVWTAPFEVNGGYSCTIAREDGAAAPASDACTGDPEDGPERNCGWDVAIDNDTCFEGFEYWVGCNPDYCAIDFECASGPEVCGVEQVSCEGQPMMRLCAGADRCLRGLALAENDGACDGPCPELRFICPTTGAYTLLTASDPEGESYACDFDTARIIDLTPE